MRTAPACALVLLASLLLAAESPAQSSNRYLNAAMKLYADLEYESALDNLKKAREKGGLTDEEDIQSSLYMGLIQFELGNVADAESAFKAALALKCELSLPKAVSPKVATLFEKARKDIWKGAACPVAAKPPPPATDVPKEPKIVVVKEPEPAPVVPIDPKPQATVEKRSGSGTTLGLSVGIPLIAVGAGLLGGGGYFGSESQRFVGLMNDPKTWQSDVTSYHQKANEAATNANILFGVGAAVAVVGVVTMVAILASSSGDAPSTAGSEMPGR
ncbi:MAG: tetratricopeptide repeat protein [Myxococcales bacterium]